MREELEQILSRFRYEFNDEATRSQILYMMNGFMESKISNNEIFDFKIEDITNVNNLYFQVIYQPTITSTFSVIDVTVVNQKLNIGFENDVIGIRYIKKLIIT